jgi:hypothetical protein
MQYGFSQQQTWADFRDALVALENSELFCENSQNESNNCCFCILQSTELTTSAHAFMA